MSLTPQQTGSSTEDTQKIMTMNNHNSEHLPWHGQRRLDWKKRGKNENLINAAGKEICIQQEIRY